jgi:hypothetical protein
MRFQEALNFEPPHDVRDATTAQLRTKWEGPMPMWNIGMESTAEM